VGDTVGLNRADTLNKDVSMPAPSSSTGNIV
jgi:hypothetical protein